MRLCRVWNIEILILFLSENNSVSSDVFCNPEILKNRFDLLKRNFDYILVNLYCQLWSIGVVVSRNIPKKKLLCLYIYISLWRKYNSIWKKLQQQLSYGNRVCSYFYDSFNLKKTTGDTKQISPDLPLFPPIIKIIHVAPITSTINITRLSPHFYMLAFYESISDQWPQSMAFHFQSSS